MQDRRGQAGRIEQSRMQMRVLSIRESSMSLTHIRLSLSPLSGCVSVRLSKERTDTNKYVLAAKSQEYIVIVYPIYYLQESAQGKRSVPEVYATLGKQCWYRPYIWAERGNLKKKRNLACASAGSYNHMVR